MKRSSNNSSRISGSQTPLAESLRELFHAALASSIATWRDLPLSLAQLRTLFIIAHGEGSTVMAVASRLGVGQPTASHLVDRLATRRLLTRSEDPDDRRRATLGLSAEGEALVSGLVGWERPFASWIAELPDEDRVTLERILGDLAAVARRRGAEQ